MHDILWGIIIIAIGLFLGGSIFLGEFTTANVFFDGLGVFFIGKGVMSLVARGETAE